MQCLLLSLNGFPLGHAAHLLLSFLDAPALRRLLAALSAQPAHAQLAHLAAARLFLVEMHCADRSLYFMHFADVPAFEFDRQRCNWVANQCEEGQLREALAEMEELRERGERVLGAAWGAVEAAAREPELPLPPIRRDTLAPHCQTVYQIVLACHSVTHGQQLPSAHPSSTQAFLVALLEAQARQAALYLSCIPDSLAHFAELTYRFMLFRNTVLALHSLTPFASLPEVMQLWKNALLRHYRRANETFLEIAGFRGHEESQYGLFSRELLAAEGYLGDYVEGVIDLSVDEHVVAFCGHSRQVLGEVYAELEQLVLGCLPRGLEGDLPQHLREWSDAGLKPNTLRKILLQLDPQCSALGEDHYCRQDHFIETCARIHGLLERSDLPVLCS